MIRFGKFRYVFIEKHDTHAVVCYRTLEGGGDGGFEIDFDDQPWMDTLLQAKACTDLGLPRNQMRHIPVVTSEEIGSHIETLQLAGLRG